MTALAAALLVVQALLAAWLARRERAHSAIALWSAALAAAAVAHAVAQSIGAPLGALETACVAVTALGAWAASERVMVGGRGFVAIGGGLLVIAAGAYPELTPSARAWLHTSAWAAGALGASWPIGRALRAPRIAEPRAAHFVVLEHTALCAAQLALHGATGWKILVPISFGAAAAAIVQIGAIVAPESRRTVNVGARVEQPRSRQRSSALLDVAPEVRRRGARRARAEGGLGKP